MRDDPNPMLQKYIPPIVLLALLLFWSVDRWTAVGLLLALMLALQKFKNDEA